MLNMEYGPYGQAYQQLKFIIQFAELLSNGIRAYFAVV